MEINGNVALKGASNELTLLSWADATDGGSFNNHQRGVVALNNGWKMQWDTIEVAADTSLIVRLQEGYTDVNYSVFTCFGTSVPATSQEYDSMAWVPTVDNKTTIVIRNIHSAAKDITYLSIGKDHVPAVPVIDTKALDFNGGEWLEEEDVILGIANQWTLQINVKIDNATLDKYLCNFDSAVTNNSQVSINWLGSVANDPIRVILRQHNGNAMRDWNFDMLADRVVGQKYSIVIVWDGDLPTDDSLKCYIDGVELTVITKTQTFSGFMDDSPRRIAIGSIGGSGFQSLTGDMHSMSWWNKPFGPAEVLALNNGGSPHTMDNRFVKGDYVSPNRLVHYWRLGRNSAYIGKDYGSLSIAADGVGTTNMDATDIVDY